jgi:hypothetical protein
MRYIVEAITPAGFISRGSAPTLADARLLEAAIGWASGVRVEIHRIH